MMARQAIYALCVARKNRITEIIKSAIPDDRRGNLEIAVSKITGTADSLIISEDLLWVIIERIQISDHGIYTISFIDGSSVAIAFERKRRYHMELVNTYTTEKY